MKVLIAGLMLFALATVLAAQCYPGGTQLDDSTTGFDWSQNFLSDLGNTHAWSGEPNWLSFYVFNAGLLAVGASLLFWSLRSASDELHNLVRSCLLIQGVALIGIGLCPFNQFPDLHHGILLVYLAAALCGCVGICIVRRHGLLIAAAVLYVFLLGSSVYLFAAYETILVLGVQQKLMVALMWAWYLLLGHLFTSKSPAQHHDVVPLE